MKILLVEICSGTSCHLLGSQALFAAVESLPKDKRERVEVREVACLQGCKQGPSVKIEGRALANVTPEGLLAALAECLEG
jgi:NADH:ubiquinone oxidoreductase subunit E